MSQASNSLLQGRRAAVLPTYARADVTIVRGEGCRVWDDAGRAYLDFGGGIAVVALGHRHPAVTAAAHAQLDELWHASNLYWTEPMLRLAGLLGERLGGAQAFFCNSGAEANEAAFKVARKATGRARIVALDGGFHGRTLGSLSVTGQPAKWEGFGPLVPGVSFAQPNDVESLERAAAPGAELAAIVLEPILGEGGVVPLEEAFVRAAAEIAREVGALLWVDEVQTGLGRTAPSSRSSSSGSSRTSSRWPRGWATASRSGPSSSGTRSRARSAPATTARRSAAIRSPPPPRAPSSRR